MGNARPSGARAFLTRELFQLAWLLCGERLGRAKKLAPMISSNEDGSHITANLQTLLIKRKKFDVAVSAPNRRLDYHSHLQSQLPGRSVNFFDDACMFLLIANDAA